MTGPIASGWSGCRVGLAPTEKRSTIESWAEEIRKECGLELVVMPREDIITSLMMPDNVALCRPDATGAYPVRP